MAREYLQATKRNRQELMRDRAIFHKYMEPVPAKIVDGIANATESIRIRQLTDIAAMFGGRVDADADINSLHSQIREILKITTN